MSKNINEPIKNKSISGNLVEDVQQLKLIFDKSFDIIYKEIYISEFKKGMIIFIDEFVNIELLNSGVVEPLINYGNYVKQIEDIDINEMQKFLQLHVIKTVKIQLGTKIREVVDSILLGNTVLLVEGEQQSLIMDLKKIEKRNIDEPTVEPLVRGPRDGFTEDLYTNISLIRRRLKTPKLKMENLKVGFISKTDIVITYLDDIVNDTLVKEIKKRISKIDIDAILESGYIEELIQDNSASVFPQLGVTERPDRLSASLLEGHVGVLIDNTPMALIAPGNFSEMMVATEDYYGNYISVSFTRFIRYFFLCLSMLLPALYIALLTFHQGMISRSLLLSIASSREGIPFPLVIETLIMQIFFEGLHEASVRLPRVTGQTVSIIGGLVLGQAAIQAGIVSAATVIVISITGIASFTIPKFNLVPAIRMIRLFLIIFSALLGLYGIFIGIFIILIHLVKLRSFDIPYLAPITPLNLSDLKDVFIRRPWLDMIFRPGFVEPKNHRRMKKSFRLLKTIRKS